MTMMRTDMTALQQRFSGGAFLAVRDSLGQNMQATVCAALDNLNRVQQAASQSGKTLEDHQHRHMETFAAVNVATVAGGGWYVQTGDTAVIPVSGVMLNRFPYMLEWATGYTALRSAIGAAVEDDSVSRIVLDIQSPGGEAAGCMEMAAFIREARKRKPIMAYVDSYAFSAAYAIASAATEIAAIPSAQLGSIGVVTMHVSYAKLLEEVGIEITFVYAGERKIDWSPYRELSDEAKASMEAAVSELYDAFLETVSAGRGDKFGVEAARETQAGCFSAKQAVSMGMADRIIQPGTAVSVFAATTNTKEIAAMADTPAATDAATIRQEERARMTATMALPEAEGREALARHLLAHTDMSVDQIKTTLAASPKAASNANPLDAAMRGTEQPNLSADDSNGAGDDKPKENRLIAAARALGHIQS